MVGRVVGHYRIIDRLGEGGMGEVFLAEDSRLRRPVALKMLASRRREDPAGCERLAREARVASLLNHPGIAVVYDTGTLEVEGDRRAFIAMEYVAGESLKARLQRGPLAPEEAAGLALQIADALEEAHARGVVHRDIKPANVVLDGRLRPKLLDFGLASYTPVADGEDTWSGPDSVLPPGTLAGTVAYMAPEQARGRSVDARADVFGLGVVLYELLAGRPPFSGASAIDVLDAVLNAPPPPIDHGRDAPPLARALEEVARQMLAKDPRDRLPDMVRVKQALERAAGRHSLPRGRAAPSAAVLPFANLTRNTEDDWLGTGLAETVASALGQIPGLSLVSRERVREALGKLGLPETPGVQGAPRLGRELGARWIVCGDYQRVAESIRIAARLVESESGAVTQAANVDGTMAGIFTAQDEVVSAVARGLRLQLASGGAHEGEETHVVEAYEAYTKGIVNLRTQTRESLDRAISFFERAIALDPSYADAHLRLASAIGLKGSFLGDPVLQRRAMAAVRRALELRPSHAEAWRELADAQLSMGGLDREALASARRAVELDPENAAAQAILARVLFIGFGEFEQAVESFARAIALNPEAGWYALQLAHCALLIGQLDRAEQHARHALILQEGFLSGVELYRREEEFVRRVSHALAERIIIEIRYRIGSALLAAGQRDRGLPELSAAVASQEERVRLGADDPFTRYYSACARALLGDAEGAAADLERAIEKRRAYVLRRLRSEPDLATVAPRILESHAPGPGL